MKKRRTTVAIVLAAAATALVAVLAGPVTSAASEQSDWPGPLGYVQRHPWPSFAGLLVVTALLAAGSAALSGRDTRRAPVAPEPHARVLRDDDPTGFVGRRWLMDQLDAFLAAHRSGYVWLEAEAGLGKTTFAAHLVRERGYLSHSSRHARGETAARRNLAAQLVGVAGSDPVAAQSVPEFVDLLAQAARAADRPAPGPGAPGLSRDHRRGGAVARRPRRDRSGRGVGGGHRRRGPVVAVGPGRRASTVEPVATPAARTPSGPREGRSGRQELTVAVLLCAAGAAAVLVATRQTWVVELTQRPPPLPELRDAQTGGALRPWLPALGWVALAGAGALLAVRGIARRVLGGLLVLAGAAVVPGALTVSGGWPLLTAAGGLVVAAAGVVTIARGPRWPSMGARYERPARTGPDSTEPARMWQELDRGEDPTAR